MTDKELADNVRYRLKELQAAIDQAANAGLSVEIGDMPITYHITGLTKPYLSVRVRKAV